MIRNCLERDEVAQQMTKGGSYIVGLLPICTLYMGQWCVFYTRGKFDHGLVIDMFYSS